MTYYRAGMLRPTDCEQCDCQQARWDGRSSVLRSDPPTGCACGHPFSRHVYRPAERTGEYPA